MLFCVAFSILFLSITNSHAYAYTLITSVPISGSFTCNGRVVNCSSATSQNFEQTFYYDLDTVNQIFPEVGKYYLFSGGISSVDTSGSLCGSSGSVSISYEYFYEISGQRYYSSYGNFVFPGNNNTSVRFGVVLRGTVSPYFSGSSWFNNYIIPKATVSYNIFFYLLSDDEVASYLGNASLSNGIQQGNDLQKKNNDLQQKNNDLQKEQNETSKGILGKITEFFASFFENLKGLFVPEDGYFSDFFTRLNDFFSEKLGMLYAPIDMFITFLNTIKDASSTDSGITFPELAWDGTVIIPETKFSFSTITKDFPDLQEKIYFVTDVILVGAVLWLLQIKLKEVLEN